MFALSFVSLSGHAAELSNWPQFGGPDGTFQLSQTFAADVEVVRPQRQWQRTLGIGMGGIVVSGDTAYATYLTPFTPAELEIAENQRVHQEVVIALDRADGTTRWKHTYDSPWRDNQEAFGGRVRAPAATPLVIGDSIITLGFSGQLHCLDRNSGTPRWQRDLVEQFDAPPVQFGYSASPIEWNGELIVMAGGRRGGLVSFDIDNGNVRWSVPCEEVSYATPVVIPGEVPQLVFLTRRDLVAVDSNGTVLWRYSLPQSELTNVPTPLVCEDGTLIVSGQGILGTHKLRPRLSQSQWKVELAWKSQEQFFYCNWILRDGVIWGCSDDLLVALDSSTGRRLGRWRGYRDANLVSTKDLLFVLDGSGTLSTLRWAANKLLVQTRHALLDERCWTPPTIVATDMFVRGGAEIACVELAPTYDATWREPQPNVFSEKPIGQGELIWGVGVSQLATDESDATGPPRLFEAAPTNEPLLHIIDAFEAGGAERARQVYTQLRESPEQPLTLSHRGELARLAIEQGQLDFARHIVNHVLHDFADRNEAKSLATELLGAFPQGPTREVHTAANGLAYLELAFRNNSSEVVQSYVAGPPQHAFRYGIPFPPGKVRTEKWPVGTKLYQTVRGIRGRVLHEVKLSDAGVTIDLVPKETP